MKHGNFNKKNDLLTINNISMKALIKILLLLLLFISCSQNKKKVSESQIENELPNQLKEIVEEKKEELLEETPKLTEESISTELDEVIEEVVEEKEIKREVPEDKKEEVVVKEKVIKKTFNHQMLHALLKKFVSSEGVVNYKELKSSEKDLDAYIELLQNNPIENDWNRNKKLAFWINSYNAFTIKLILSNYPLNSITDLEGGKPWDKKWISLNGQIYSLNDIENTIIRPRFKEARIHFAVNCAAKSCPKIGNFAYEENTLNTLLEKQTRSFINNKENSITPDKVQVSKIFEWYATDFGDLISFLNTYSNVKINEDATIEFIEYDWSLNE